MSTLTPDHPDLRSNYLTHSRGVLSWMFTLDHKRIGVMYLVSVLASFLLGGILALLVRTELIAPGETIMGQDAYNRTFTMHGAVMIFLVIIPSIPAALALQPLKSRLDRLCDEVLLIALPPVPSGNVPEILLESGLPHRIRLVGA